MNEVKIGSPFFIINSKGINEHRFSFTEWTIEEEISMPLIAGIKDKKYSLIFLKFINVFSHSMNVLRKLVRDNDVVVVVGIDKIKRSLEKAIQCEIIVDSRMIILDKKIKYVFDQFDYEKETSEEIAYCFRTNSISYKPNFRYSPELAEIIIQGFNSADGFFSNDNYFWQDYQGRIWGKGYIFPSKIAHYYIQNELIYYQKLAAYISVLSNLFNDKFIGKYTADIEKNLVSHFRYSLIFSFSLSTYSESVAKAKGINRVEDVYNIFIQLTPINDKKHLLPDALSKMKLFLNNILNGKDVCDNFFQVYNQEDTYLSNLELLFFVTSMVSDIRRCVIDTLIENNNWFAHICSHRTISDIH